MVGDRGGLTNSHVCRPLWSFYFLFFSLSLLITNEYLKKSRFGPDHRKVAFIVLAVVLILQYAAIIKHADQLFSILVPLLALAVIPLIIIFTNSIANLPVAFAAILGMMLLNFYLSFIPAIAFSDKIQWKLH